MRSALALGVIALAGAIGGIVMVSGGCLGKPRFECAAAAECSTGGVCEPDGFCSFTDASCPSGRRYGDLSGPQANQCVGVPPDAPPVDAPPDAVPDAFVGDARECFGAASYELCFAGMPPMGDVTLAGALDTVTDPRCAATLPASWLAAGQPDACLILGRSISTSGTVTVTGARPLVLLADTITIGSTLDVAAHRTVTAAVPGAPATQCAAFPVTPVDSIQGAGGGAGGSFMHAGGNGGQGNAAATVGGTAPPIDAAAPTVLRGGCPGQPGGTGTAAAGAPGQGGGAIYLTASRITITAAGIINVSGSGASGGGAASGGSGGGAGGMIVLHAAEAITATGARLLANGGGASAGNDATSDFGDDPVPTTPLIAAPGGNGSGGRGGAGFAGTLAATSGGNGGAMGNSAGGGGGGGGGYIQSNLALAGAVVSPAATIVP